MKRIGGRKGFARTVERKLFRRLLATIFHPVPEIIAGCEGISIDASGKEAQLRGDFKETVMVRMSEQHLQSQCSGSLRRQTLRLSSLPSARL
jgi:hypothetical protein